MSCTMYQKTHIPTHVKTTLANFNIQYMSFLAIRSTWSHLTGRSVDRMLAPYMVGLSSNTGRPKISTYVMTTLSLFTRHLHMKFEGPSEET